MTDGKMTGQEVYDKVNEMVMKAITLGVKTEEGSKAQADLMLYIRTNPSLVAHYCEIVSLQVRKEAAKLDLVMFLMTGVIDVNNTIEEKMEELKTSA